MAGGIRPIRRVVTGVDSRGRSGILYDGAAPSVKPSAFKQGTGMTDIWAFDRCPAPIDGDRDDGNRPFHFEPPEHGGRLRIVQSDPRPADYDAASDRFLTREHPPRRTEGGTWERGAQNLYTTRIHKSETLDYGILIAGERILVTDAGKHLLKPGDVCIQIGSWHAWEETAAGSQMAFVMMAGRFDEGAAVPIQSAGDGESSRKGDPQSAATRRVVVVDEEERSRAIADGPTPDVRLDPARPGFVCARMWVTTETPVKLKDLRESLHVTPQLAPPAQGSVCSVLTLPPDDDRIRRHSRAEVEAHFATIGLPEAVTHSADAPHPYMQRMPTLDFCMVIEGEITLVLESGEVTLGAGDTVVQRGTRHAWSNRSRSPAVVAISSHDAAR